MRLLGCGCGQASKAAIAESSNKANPFSKSFDPSTTRTLKGQWDRDTSLKCVDRRIDSICMCFGPLSGTEGYGKPPPGSKSEERAKHAKEWVDTEIDKLIAVIK